VEGDVQAYRIDQAIGSDGEKIRRGIIDVAWGPEDGAERSRARRRATGREKQCRWHAITWRPRLAALARGAPRDVLETLNLAQHLGATTAVSDSPEVARVDSLARKYQSVEARHRPRPGASQYGPGKRSRGRRLELLAPASDLIEIGQAALPPNRSKRRTCGGVAEARGPAGRSVERRGREEKPAHVWAAVGGRG